MSVWTIHADSEVDYTLNAVAHSLIFALMHYACPVSNLANECKKRRNLKEGVCFLAHRCSLAIATW